MKIQDLVNHFKNYKIGYVQINGYAKPVGEKFKQGQGEVSNVKINVGFSYGNAVRKDIIIAETKEVPFIDSDRYTRLDWDNASAEIKRSLSSPSENHSRGQVEAYIDLVDNGSVKWNKSTKSVIIRALVVRKDVIVEGEYRQVNSRAKTIAKKRIKKELNLHTDKIRSYRIDRISTLRMNGETLEIGM